MNKIRYKKTIILLLTLTVLVISTSIVSASDTNNTTTHDKQVITANTTHTNHTIQNYQKTVNNKQIKKTSQNHIINNTTYDNYFDEDGVIYNDAVKDNDTLTITGTITNKNFYIEDLSLNIEGNNATLIESTIEAIGKPITVSNITINNTDTRNSAIIFYSSNCTLQNSRIITNTTKDVKAVYIVGNNTTIKNNIITVGGPSDEIDWYSDPDLARTLAVAIVSNNNLIKNNTITTYRTISKISYGSIESITIQGSISGNRAENNIIEDNIITTTTTDYAYGINLGQNINNNTIRNNIINTTGNNFADSIQAFSAVNYLIITGNNITSTSNNFSDGIAVSKDNMAGKTMNNIITYNNMHITGYTSTLIDIGNLEYSTIAYNNGTINSTYPYGFNIKGDNNTIQDNNINLTSNHTNMTGIHLTSSNNNNITNNTINTNTNYAVILTDSDNNMIKNNYLYGVNKADKSVLNKGNNIIQNNKPIIKKNITLTVYDTIGKTNNTILLNATVKAVNSTTVNSGKLVFKINGKTLRYDNGTPIYIAIVNGKATYNYTIPCNWSAKNYTITAVYSGTWEYNYSRSNNSTLTIVPTNNSNTIIKINPVTGMKNETRYLNASIHDINGIKVDCGNVIFKINGKTIMNSEGKPVYTAVHNGTVSYKFNIPYTWSAKNYTITAVYTGDKTHQQSRVNNTLTVLNRNANITITSKNLAKINTNHILSARITENNNTLNRGVVIFKINGKTLKDSQGNTLYCNVTRGIASLKYSLKGLAPKNYTLIAVYSDKMYNRIETKTILTITK